MLLLSLHDLSVLNEWQMPDPLSFREEGGTSMHPDGTRFITVIFELVFVILPFSQGGSDLWVREFEVSSGKLLRTFKGHHGPVRYLFSLFLLNS